jgi:hypothetical protein
MMAEALAKGFVGKGVIQANQVFCHDPSSARQEVFRAMGANPCQSGEEVYIFLSSAIRCQCTAACHGSRARAFGCRHHDYSQFCRQTVQILKVSTSCVVL